MSEPTVSVVVLAYGPEPLLEECIDSLIASRDVQVTVELVDNGCSNPALEVLSRSSGVRLHRPGSNLGFAAGVNLGSAHAEGEFLALVNSDAVVTPDALRHLVRELRADPGTAIVTASVRFYEAPDTINSSGNPLHALGLVWAGGIGEPASAHRRPGEVAVASGAGMMLLRSVWKDLGGFEERLFMYHEDVDLSLAAWQAGYSVRYVPDAVVLHDYAFARNVTKLTLAERNRLVVVLTRYPAPVLRRLLPILLLTELGSLLLGGLPGLRRAKLRGWMWLLRNTRWLVRRRRAVLARATKPDAFVALFVWRVGNSTPTSGGLGTRLLDWALPRYAELVGLAR